MKYNRRYYLHRRLRRAGFRLSTNKVGKTIDVRADQRIQARDNRYIAELRDTHNYAVQYINPMMML
jgi:hypothetical protein